MMPMVIRHSIASASHCHGSRMGAFSVVSMMSSISGILARFLVFFIEKGRLREGIIRFQQVSFFKKQCVF